jgi:monoamine oxidase
MSSHDKKKTSRRHFLKTAAAGAAGVATASQLGASESQPQPKDGITALPGLEPPIELDIAIVGAGIAGCHAAYRLATATAADIKPGTRLYDLFEQSKGRLQIGLFEYSQRVGGRLLSPKVQGIPSYRSEFGGFRFHRRMHVVWDTAEHLGLTDEPFHYDGKPAQQQNIVYVRGRRLTREQVNLGLDLPYNLRDSELRMRPSKPKDPEKEGEPDFPGALESYVINQSMAGVLPDVDIDLQNPPPGYVQKLPAAPNGYSAIQQQYQIAFKAEDWETVERTSDLFQHAKVSATVDGRNLQDWSWWALKRRFLSQEAVAFLEDTGGYNELSRTGNPGSNNISENFYFPATTGPLANGLDTDWRHIEQGYSALPGRLHQGFTEAGGKTFFNYQLARFDPVDEPGGIAFYDMLFYQRTPGRKVVKSAVEIEELCASGDDADCHRVQAKLVILALPQRSVQLLSPSTPYLQEPAVQQVLNAVGPVPAIRFFLAYDTPWWNSVYDHPANGRSTTDLGLRQFYYWFTEEDGKALVLVSYASSAAEEYWRSLEDGERYDDLQGSVDLTDPRQPQAGGPRQASKVMALEAHRQFMEAIGVDDAPMPYYAHFQNWTKDPWGGGWHFYQSGFDQNEIIELARQPVSDQPVYIMGECWSHIQGWVQGAVNTAESVLQCKIGLKWPSFIRRHGTWLGPGTRWLIGDETNPCLPEDPIRKG